MEDIDMDMADYVDQLRGEIAQLQAMLEPLVSGKMHVGSRSAGGQWEDVTPARIEHTKRTIAMYETIIERLDHA
jgi:hypothetical protein